MLKEWPLVAFTVAGQTAVGVLLIAGLPLILPAGAAAGGVIREPGLTILAVVLGLLAAAALLSFFHLHHPLRARRVLANLRTSWLSREILFELVFGALVASAAVLAWTGRGTSGLIKGLCTAAGLAGLMFLLSMTRLYMLETLPAWNQAYTLLSFLLTSLSQGALAASLANAAYRGSPSRAGLLSLAAFLLVGAETAIAYLLAPVYGKLGYRPGPSLRAPAELPPAVSRIRLILSIAALVMIAAALVPAGGRPSAGPDGVGFLAVGMLFALAGQAAGRFLFYGLLRRPRPSAREAR